jgi:hypothetical protein
MVEIPRYKPMAGEYFYGAKCQTCGITVPFQIDPEDGKGPSFVKQNPGWAIMICDSGHSHRYRISEMLRMQRRSTASE